MDTPKLKLKETPPREERSINWDKTRYAEPKPPTIFERLLANARRFLYVILLVAVVLSIFLLIPFHKWDDYKLKMRTQERLVALNANPDSFTELRQVSKAAVKAGILWGQPEGPRPEKWYQRSQTLSYNADYAVIQTLALGLIRHGKAARGLRELERLQQRTSFTTRPSVPRTDRAIEICRECENGKITKTCEACQGTGVCSHDTGRSATSKSSFPSGKISLRDTRTSGVKRVAPIKQPDKTPQSKVTKECAACGGSGKHTAACPACDGKGIVIHHDQIPRLLQDSITGAIAANKKAISAKRAIHTLASLQATILGKVKKAGQTTFANLQDDTTFDALQTNTVVAVHTEAIETIDLDTAALSSEDYAAMTPIAKVCLRQACGNLQHSPLSTEDLHIMMEVTRLATNSPALRSSAMTAVALASLLRSDTNTFTRAMRIQKKTFPDEPQLLTIRKSDYISICKECQGKGTQVVPCPRCMHPDHKHSQTEVCKMCNGKKEMVVRCYACKGVASTFKLSDNVRSNYTDVLVYIAKMCEDAEP